MNADDFRYFYNYHFAQNREIWDRYIVPLSQEQFVQPVAYSMGSVRNQMVHLMNVDNAWFSDLRGVTIEDYTAAPDDRTLIRAHWDTVEQMMQDYLAQLRDDMLHTKPLGGEDKDLLLWQILLHVVNHGTDHRAQVLRAVHDAGVKTGPQDFIFYVYDHP